MGQPFALDDAVFDVAPRHLREPAGATGERAGGFDLVIDGERLAARLVDRGGGRFELRVGERRRPLWLAVDGDRVFVHAEGRSFLVTRVDALERLRAASRAARGGAGLVAPMPGVVTEVRAPVGSPVAPGDTVLVIESMKLQTAVASEHAGTVSEIAFEVGQSFDQGALLARIEAEEDAGAAGGASGGTPGGQDP